MSDSVDAGAGAMIGGPGPVDPPADTYQVGDVVMLNSGSPPLTVSAIGDDGLLAVVVWVSADMLCIRSIPSAAVHLVEGAECTERAMYEYRMRFYEGDAP